MHRAACASALAGAARKPCVYLLLESASPCVFHFQEHRNSRFLRQSSNSFAKASARCRVGAAGSIGRHIDLHRLSGGRGVGRLSWHGPVRGRPAPRHSFCPIPTGEQRQAGPCWPVTQTGAPTTHRVHSCVVRFDLRGARRLCPGGFHRFRNGVSSRFPLVAAHCIRPILIVCLQIHGKKPPKKWRPHGD